MKRSLRRISIGIIAIILLLSGTNLINRDVRAAEPAKYYLAFDRRYEGGTGVKSDELEEVLKESWKNLEITVTDSKGNAQKVKNQVDYRGPRGGGENLNMSYFPKGRK